MLKRTIVLGILLMVFGFLMSTGTTLAHGEQSEGPKVDGGAQMLEHMQEMHRGHQHEHDFQAMQRMSPEDMQEMMQLMTELGLAIPPMDSRRGRTLFLQKGCVVCHSINDVGGDVGPSFNASEMPEPMNAFEFAARMWRGAPAMVAMQQAQFGEIIELSGRELADIIGFVHDEVEQSKLTVDQIPEQFKDEIVQ